MKTHEQLSVIFTQFEQSGSVVAHINREEQLNQVAEYIFRNNGKNPKIQIEEVDGVFMYQQKDRFGNFVNSVHDPCVYKHVKFTNTDFDPTPKINEDVED